jgi:hypothetical protein
MLPFSRVVTQELAFSGHLGDFASTRNVILDIRRPRSDESMALVIDDVPLAICRIFLLAIERDSDLWRFGTFA